MDPRIAWCPPEQLGPAYKHWLRLWETSTASKQHGGNKGTMRNDTINHLPGNSNNEDWEKQHDYIPLQCKSDSKSKQGTPYARKEFNTTDGANNIASTYGLNHSSNLDILEKHKHPWKKTDKCYSTHSIMCLHEEIKDFYEYMLPTQAETNMRNQVVKRIREVIQGVWPDAKIEVYGSFETDLYLPTSDIDLVVFGKWPNIPLWTLENELVERGIANRSTIKVLDKASVPIIKVVDKETDVKVDISFNQLSGVHSVKLIKEFLAMYPNLRYLALVLKQFLLQRDLNEVYTGGISSYCLLYLIISFMQMHPTYDARDPNVNLAVLLIEFFELYGCNFNYNKVGIRIKDGGSYLQKQHLTSLNRGTVPSFLYIEDPLNAENDLGRSSYGAYHVKKSFEYAYSVLRNSGFTTGGQSVLGRIIRVTDEVVQYRQWIGQNFPLFYPLEEIRGELSSDSVPSDSSNSARKPNQHNGKSYAKAVTMNSAQSKRSIASGTTSHLHVQHSGGESDCHTDVSTSSPFSSHSVSAGSSSSLCSDTDSDNVSVASEVTHMSHSTKSIQHIPIKVHKSVSVSTVLSNGDSASKSTSTVRPSQSLSSLSNPLTSNKHDSPSQRAPSSNNYGKAGYSKHSSSRIVRNSNSKPVTVSTSNTSNGSITSHISPSHTQSSQHTVTTSSSPAKTRTNHKQSGGKRRKTGPVPAHRDVAGRTNGNASR